MEKTRIAPETIEEKIVWYAIIGTWGFYALGALYIVAPAIAWILFLIGLKKVVVNYLAGGKLNSIGVSWSVFVWFFGMFWMLIALIIGHLDHQIGLPAIIKSCIGWAKGWALLALFPFIGCLSIRPQLIIRATCIVSWHTVLLAPVFVAAWLLHLPQVLYVSPLKAVGGPGPEFFMLSLYEIDPGSGVPRWRLFTPWAPAAGFVANVYFLFALYEQDRRWKIAGIVGCILMILMSQSRLALVALISVSGTVWYIARFAQPVMLYLTGVGVVVLGMIAVPLMQTMDSVLTAFKEARSDSSRVRAALGRIAVDRWSAEAPVWGHGVVERGPHMVEYMPIGSHHSWFGLLFVKGIVGLMSLAVPMLASLVDLVAKSSKSSDAQIGLGMVLILFLYTFGENLEILAYLFWPGLLFLGAGTRTGQTQAKSNNPEHADSAPIEQTIADGAQPAAGTDHS